MKYSKEKIWLNNSITEFEYKLTIKPLKALVRKMNKVSRDMADKRAHDYNIELRFIKEYMDKNFGERITLQKLKTELSSQNLLTIPLSTTTISKILKEKLNYSFKKSVEFEWAATQKFKVKVQGGDQDPATSPAVWCWGNLYWRVFSINSSKVQQYAWGKRGCCSYLKTFNENFSPSSCVPF